MHREELEQITWKIALRISNSIIFCEDCLKELGEIKPGIIRPLEDYPDHIDHKVCFLSPVISIK